MAGNLQRQETVIDRQQSTGRMRRLEGIIRIVGSAGRQIIDKAAMISLFFFDALYSTKRMSITWTTPAPVLAAISSAASRAVNSEFFSTVAFYQFAGFKRIVELFHQVVTDTALTYLEYRFSMVF